ncbi:MAG: protein kinase [Phycisphaerales bacterium]|nr:protein kinase [Phycisphaerales bacterium]
MPQPPSPPPGQPHRDPTKATSAHDASRAPPSPGVVPERIGPYAVLRALGHGGMGAVYLARRDDSQFTQLAAIKVMRTGMTSPDDVRRFVRERQVLLALNHPNIARVLDGGTTDDGRPYFVMEYIEGRPLDQYCNENRLSVRQRVDLFLKVCAAVAYSHDHLIVHRDLKPGNILVNAEGEPKLLDFGIAKLINPQLFQVADATDIGLRLMTLAYASPEQAQGQMITPASDVYALGVILYELLTGRRPYHLDETAYREAIRVICEENPSLPSTAVTRPLETTTASGTTTVPAEKIAEALETNPGSLRRQLAGDLDDIVMVALAKTPRLRYGSVAQLADDLRRHLEGDAVQARRLRRSVPWGWYTATRFVVRHRAAVAAAAAAALALVAGLSLAVWQWRVAEARRAEAEAQRQTAESNFAQARALAETLVGRFHDRVLQLPGSVVARELIVRTAAAAAEDLGKRSEQDASLRPLLADAFERLGDVQGGLRTPHRGDLVAAEASYRRSLEIRTDLARGPAPAASLRLALASSHLKIGDVLRETGNAAAAADAYTHSLAELDRLSAADARDAAAIRLRGLALVARANAQLRIKGANPDAAQRAMQEAADILAPLARTEPTPENRNAYARARFNLADLHRDAGRPDEALAAFREAEAIRRDLLAADPGNGLIRRDLAGTLLATGLTLTKSGDRPSAVATLRQAQDHLEKLLTFEPNDARAERDLVRVLEALGDALRTTDPKSAADTHRDALARAERLAQADPRSLTLRRSAAALGIRVARAAANENDHRRALTLITKAVTNYTTLVRADPTNPGDRDGLKRACTDFTLLAANPAAADAIPAAERQPLLTGLADTLSQTAELLRNAPPDEDLNTAMTSAIDAAKAASRPGTR